MIQSSPSILEKGIRLIKDYVKTLPEHPGVYRMLGKNSTVLYIGKAKNLKKRVLSYTQPERLPLRLKRMVAETIQMEFITTHTEAEALLLEANLIKKLGPQYNVLMKDGKSYAYIYIGTDHPYPLLTKQRGLKDLPGEYYGPFASADAIYTTLTSLHRAFLLRSCPDNVFNNRKRPCLQYQIKRCSAPCVNYISQEAYRQLVDQTRNFLRGKSAEIQKELAEKMLEASQHQAYEEAALYRDRIRALTQIQAKQSIHSTVVDDADIFAIEQTGNQTCVQIFLFRHGSNFGHHASFLTHDKELSLSEILLSFLGQFYIDSIPPKEILLNIPVPDSKLLHQALTLRAGHNVTIKIPKSGPKAELIKHAYTNAIAALERKLAESTSHRKLMDGVCDIFSLATPLTRIEVFDNSHTQGSFPVGCMIVAGPEGFIKKAYRKFNIKSNTLTPGDDYAMMREVLKRRFSRALNNDKNEDSQWPDLVILDGGPGQLSAAQETLVDLGIADIKLVAIAKGPQRNAGLETFYLTDKTSFKLKQNDPVLYYIQRLRDEAHRFAIGTHRARRTKSLHTSQLDLVPGIGRNRKKSLLNHFGSAKAVAGAGLTDLMAVEGISKSIAKKIYDYFHSSS